jgi:hypothetical protein
MSLTVNEKLTLAALIFGPVLSVIITLVVERRRQTRERRFQLVRILLATRGLPGDAGYNAAINLIPAEFHSCPGVIKAWKDYLSHVTTDPSAERRERHFQESGVKLTALIYQILRTLGVTFSESDIQLTTYQSRGFIDRDNLYLASLQATTEIAASLKEQTAILRDNALAQPR